MIQVKKQISTKETPVFYILILSLALFSIFLCGYSLIILREKKENLMKEIEKGKKELITLNEKKEWLERQIEKKEIIFEEEIRKQGYVKEGEQLVVIIKPTNFFEEKKDLNLTEKKSDFLTELKNFLKSNILRW